MPMTPLWRELLRRTLRRLENPDVRVDAGTAMEKGERISQYAAAISVIRVVATMVAARQRLVLELLDRRKPPGAGGRLRDRHARRARPWAAAGRAGGDRGAERALPRGRRALDMGRTRSMSFKVLEDSSAAIRELLPALPDVILFSRLLNESSGRRRSVRARGLLAAGGVVHVNVPNAYSITGGCESDGPDPG